MPISYKFTKEQIEELKTAKKKNKNKNIDKRLTALLMRAEGKSRVETAKVTGYKNVSITRLTAKYMRNRIKAIVDNHYNSNNWNMDYEKEEELLEQFKKAAGDGLLKCQ